MRVLFRADGGSDIGGGHVMRCLALADRIRATGGDVYLAAISLDSQLRARAVAHEVTVLSPGDPLDVGSRDDAEWLVSQAQRLNIDWVVSDGYRFDADYQRVVHSAGVHQLVIDDYGHCDHYCAELVLNQNGSARPGLYSQRAPHTRLLLGADYVLLRTEFMRAATRPLPARAGSDRILITMGAADPDNVSATIARALTRIADASLSVRVLIGPSNPHAAELRQQLDDPRIDLIDATDDMTSLMTWADIAISAAGSTTYELCCMGVPSLLVVIADNQRGVAAALAEAGAAINLGWHQELDPADLVAVVDRLRDDAAMRGNLVERARSLIDGLGSQRVLEALETYVLTDSSAAR